MAGVITVGNRTSIATWLLLYVRVHVATSINTPNFPISIHSSIWPSTVRYPVRPAVVLIGNSLVLSCCVLSCLALLSRFAAIHNLVPELLQYLEMNSN